VCQQLCSRVHLTSLWISLFAYGGGTSKARLGRLNFDHLSNSSIDSVLRPTGLGCLGKSGLDAVRFVGPGHGVDGGGNCGEDSLCREGRGSWSEARAFTQAKWKSGQPEIWLKIRTNRDRLNNFPP
jgi:hypothetical protein